MAGASEGLTTCISHTPALLVLVKPFGMAIEGASHSVTLCSAPRHLAVVGQHGSPSLVLSACARIVQYDKHLWLLARVPQCASSHCWQRFCSFAGVGM